MNQAATRWASGGCPVASSALGAEAAGRSGPHCSRFEIWFAISAAVVVVVVVVVAAATVATTADVGNPAHCARA